MKHSDIFENLLAVLKPIDFCNRVNLPDEENLKRKHYVIETVDEVLGVAKKLNWLFSIMDGSIYVFNGEFWKHLRQSRIEFFLGKAARKLGVDKYDAKYHLFRADLVKQFMTSVYLINPLAQKDEVLINLLNGTFVVNVNNHYLKKFVSDDFLTYQLPFGFNPNSACPLFENFLNRVLPEKSQQMILAEYLGYVFIKRKRLNLEKFLILYGDGANGKSVFFEVVNAIMGSDNVTNFSLKSLTNDIGYQRAKLSRKLLNYGSELSRHMNSDIFKQLVSGESVEVRLPYGEPFILEDYAKFIFNTNELPRDTEQNEAFFRRFLIIPFNVTIPEKERDLELSQKIISSELPGVFNWILAGLDRLLIQKTFTPSEDVDNVLSEYKKRSDSVCLFLKDDHYEKSNQYEIPLSIFYIHYHNYALDSGFKPISLFEFSSKLRKLNFIVTRRNKGNIVGVAEKKVS